MYEKICYVCIANGYCKYKLFGCYSRLLFLVNKFYKEANMGYVKAEEILPMEVIELIQEYVDGQNIYIPRKENRRAVWGSGTKIRKELGLRNRQIYSDFISGKKVSELAEVYFLSEKSIQRIVREEKRNIQC